MLFVFSPDFVAGRKIVVVYNFVASLRSHHLWHMRKHQIIGTMKLCVVYKIFGHFCVLSMEYWFLEESL